MKIKIVKEKEVALPKYETLGSAGMDLRANIKEPIVLNPFERKLLPTGIKLAIPEGYELQIRTRSGMALKHGIIMLNSPGTIDSDYRNEIGLIVANLSNVPYTIQPQERLGQAILNKVERIEWEEVETLDETDRKGGFGSTGKN